MSYFEQNSPWELQRRVEEDQSKIRKQIEKRNRPYSPQALLLVFAVAAMIGIAYLFWPLLKGSWLTEKASVLLDRGVSLTGIIYSVDNPTAIVNSKIVHEGDMVDDVKVIKIQKDSVEFERADKRWSQSLSAAEEGVYSGSSGLPVLLVLGAKGCPPCQRMKPILNRLKFKYTKKFEVKYIDVWKNRAAGAKYEIKMIPTQIFYDSEGREVFRHVGFYSEDEILAVWKSIGVKL